MFDNIEWATVTDIDGLWFQYIKKNHDDEPIWYVLCGFEEIVFDKVGGLDHYAHHPSEDRLYRWDNQYILKPPFILSGEIKISFPIMAEIFAIGEVTEFTTVRELDAFVRSELMKGRWLGKDSKLHPHSDL